MVRFELGTAGASGIVAPSTLGRTRPELRLATTALTQPPLLCTERIGRSWLPGVGRRWRFLSFIDANSPTIGARIRGWFGATFIYSALVLNLPGQRGYASCWGVTSACAVAHRQTMQACAPGYDCGFGPSTTGSGITRISDLLIRKATECNQNRRYSADWIRACFIVSLAYRSPSSSDGGRISCTGITNA